MQNEKYHHIKFTIERFDHLYEVVNNKGSFYTGLNTFILGGLCAGYIALGNKIEHNFYFWLPVTLLFSFCISSIIYTINATAPFLKDNSNNDDIPSLIFFGGVAEYNLNGFIEKFNEKNEGEITEDMLRQVHCLATGLNKKFKNLKIASRLLLFQFIAIIFFCIYIIQNYKP